MRYRNGAVLLLLLSLPSCMSFPRERKALRMPKSLLLGELGSSQHSVMAQGSPLCRVAGCVLPISSKAETD